MPFGKHKGDKMIEIPEEYLFRFYKNNEKKVLYGRWKSVFEYVKENLGRIKKTLYKGISLEELSKRGKFDWRERNDWKFKE